MRIDRAIRFPYKIIHNTAYPIIPVEIKGIIIHAFVDSGASFSIFTLQEAEAIGINYRKGKPSSVIIGDGRLIQLFFYVLPMTIGNITLKARIGFSPDLKVRFNLLGRKDVFERFTITFDDVKRFVTFIPNRVKRRQK